METTKFFPCSSLRPLSFNFVYEPVRKGPFGLQSDLTAKRYTSCVILYENAGAIRNSVSPVVDTFRSFLYTIFFPFSPLDQNRNDRTNQVTTGKMMRDSDATWTCQTSSYYTLQSSWQDHLRRQLYNPCSTPSMICLEN